MVFVIRIGRERRASAFGFATVSGQVRSAKNAQKRTSRRNVYIGFVEDGFTPINKQFGTVWVLKYGGYATDRCWS